MTGSEPTSAKRVCLTCSDAAQPVLVLRRYEPDLALVRTVTGGEEEISVALVDAEVGDTVLVHAKEAIARLERP